MTPAEFLHAVWPEDGVYCLAVPYTIPGTNKRTYLHKTFDSIDEAAGMAAKLAPSKDVFFAVHTLKKHQIWNPRKQNYKTGEMGAYSVRLQKNMAKSRAFFFDLDVGEEADKYDNRRQALADLDRFCKEAKLPVPMITSSGGGLHVYWLMEEALDSETWARKAKKLKKLAEALALKADPARTTDTASVLRVAGTYNLKQPDNPRPVKVHIKTERLPNDEFERLVDEALTRADVTPTNDLFANLVHRENINSNIQQTFDSPPVSISALIKACAQTRYLLSLKEKQAEPQWYHGLNLLRFTENGRDNCHKFSAGHPEYSKEQTDEKIDQLEGKQLGPTTCEMLARVCGEDRCRSCPHVGKVKSPLVAARRNDAAPEPQVQVQITPVQTATVTIPSPPEPYIRLKSGGVAKNVVNGEGDTVQIKIYDHDLYPLNRKVNEEDKVERQTWRVTLPRSGDNDFEIAADALYDSRKLTSSLANAGVYVKPSNVKDVQDYMVAYINTLQQETDAENQISVLGWQDEARTRFALPNMILNTDGTIDPVHLTARLESMVEEVHAGGSLEEQIRLLHFYNHDEYIANQFYIACSLISPYLYVTGRHGLLVNAVGKSGASKSSTLYTACGHWGRPDLYPLNGTQVGSTVKARYQRLFYYAALPFGIDEITHMPIKVVNDFAMSITQPKMPTKLDVRSNELRRGKSYKASFTLTTSNSSLHSLLSTNNVAGDAGSMRVFEIPFGQHNVHRKWEADQYLLDINRNYGHTGPLFMQETIKHKEAIERDILKKMREIDEKARIKSSERYWGDGASLGIVGTYYGKLIGIMPYDHQNVEDWLISKQIEDMRVIVREEYTTSQMILANYLEKINTNIVVTKRAEFSVTPDSVGDTTAMMIREPRGELLGHYDHEKNSLYLLKAGFKEYCVNAGANYRQVIKELTECGVISNPDVRRILGYGTEFAKAQSRCFAVDMTHREITGNVVVDNMGATQDLPLDKSMRQRMN